VERQESSVVICRIFGKTGIMSSLVMRFEKSAGNTVALSNTF
jgi:hypothetical protein